MKGCVLFALCFLSGLALIVSGFVYDGLFATNLNPITAPVVYERHVNTVRALQVSGVALTFVSIFSAAGWAFFTRRREAEPDGP